MKHDFCPQLALHAETGAGSRFAPLSNALKGQTVSVLYDRRHGEVDVNLATGTLQGGFFVSLMREAARRGEFTLEEDVSPSDFFAVEEFRNWTEFRDWGVDHYDIFADWSDVGSSSLEQHIQSPYGFLDTSMTLVVPTKNQINFATRAFSFLLPFHWDLWVSIFCAAVFSGFIFLMLEKGQNDEDFDPLVSSLIHALGHSIWLSFVMLTDAGCYSPRTIQGKIFSLFWSFLVLLIVASYTASLASFLTMINTTDDYPVKTLADAERLGYRLCIVDLYPSVIERISRVYPAMMSRSTIWPWGSDIFRPLRNGECDASLMSVFEWDSMSIDRNFNANCDVTVSGEPFWMSSSGFAVRSDYAQRCTSLLNDVLEVLFTELAEEGFLESRFAEYLEVKQTNECTIGVAAAQRFTRQLSVETMAGAFIIFGAVSILIVIWSKSAAYADTNADSENSMVGSPTRSLGGADKSKRGEESTRPLIDESAANFQSNGDSSRALLERQGSMRSGSLSPKRFVQLMGGLGSNKVAQEPPRSLPDPAAAQPSSQAGAIGQPSSQRSSSLKPDRLNRASTTSSLEAADDEHEAGSNLKPEPERDADTGASLNSLPSQPTRDLRRWQSSRAALAAGRVLAPLNKLRHLTDSGEGSALHHIHPASDHHLFGFSLKAPLHHEHSMSHHDQSFHSMYAGSPLGGGSSPLASHSASWHLRATVRDGRGHWPMVEHQHGEVEGSALLREMARVQDMLRHVLHWQATGLPPDASPLACDSDSGLAVGGPNPASAGSPAAGFPSLHGEEKMAAAGGIAGDALYHSASPIMMAAPAHASPRAPARSPASSAEAGHATATILDTLPEIPQPRRRSSDTATSPLLLAATGVSVAQELVQRREAVVVDSGETGSDGVAVSASSTSGCQLRAHRRDSLGSLQASAGKAGSASGHAQAEKEDTPPARDALRPLPAAAASGVTLPGASADDDRSSTPSLAGRGREVAAGAGHIGGGFEGEDSRARRERGLGGGPGGASGGELDGARGGDSGGGGGEGGMPVQSEPLVRQESGWGEVVCRDSDIDV